jgi:hypothetical protein
MTAQSGTCSACGGEAVQADRRTYHPHTVSWPCPARIEIGGTGFYGADIYSSYFLVDTP